MRKRSKYRPKPIALNPMAFVLENMRPVAHHESYLIDLKIKNSDAMVALLRGAATRQDINTLMAMSNITEALYRLGFGSEFKDVATQGSNAIAQIVHRAVETKRFTPTGPEIQALNLLMELHDAQMDVITVRDMERAIALGYNLLRSPKATLLPTVEVTNAGQTATLSGVARN